MSDSIRRVITAIIVDDNDTTRAVLRGILRQVNIELIAEVNSGQAALAALRRQKPVILCLDIMLPDGNGLDVLKEVREEFPDVRVLMVTGEADRASVETAIERGAAGYVVKPFNTARVVDAIKQALLKRVAGDKAG